MVISASENQALVDVAAPGRDKYVFGRRQRGMVRPATGDAWYGVNDCAREVTPDDLSGNETDCYSLFRTYSRLLVTVQCRVVRNQ